MEKFDIIEWNLIGHTAPQYLAHLIYLAHSPEDKSGVIAIRGWRLAGRIHRQYLALVFGDGIPECAFEFVEFVKDFLSNLGLTRLYLVGHSIGGGIALHYALRFPHDMKKLVLVSSMCLDKEIALWVRFLSSPVFRRSLGEAALVILRAIEKLVKLSYLPLKFVNPLPRARIDLGKHITIRRGQTAVVRNRLHELVMPALLVWGARDAIVPVSHAHVAAGLIPDCQLHIFEECGHTVHKQKGHEFSQLLIGFLG